jgi:acyl dehydratase
MSAVPSIRPPAASCLRRKRLQTRPVIASFRMRSFHQTNYSWCKTRQSARPEAPVHPSAPRVPIMRFSDLYVGQIITTGPYVVSESEIIEFASKYDPQWFHTDAIKARRGHFGGLIASGWHTCSIAMRMSVDAVFAGSETLASPGIDNLRWPHPVRPGDRLSFAAVVTSLRRSRTRTHLGIMQWQIRLANQDSIDVLHFDATSLFGLSDDAQAQGSP